MIEAHVHACLLLENNSPDIVWNAKSSLLFNHGSYRFPYNLCFDAAVAMQICGMCGDVITKRLPFHVHLSPLYLISTLKVTHVP